MRFKTEEVGGDGVWRRIKRCRSCIGRLKVRIQTVSAQFV